MKKILIGLIISFLFHLHIYALTDAEKEAYNNFKYEDRAKMINNMEKTGNTNNDIYKFLKEISESEENDLENSLNQILHDENCESGGNCIDKSNFIIKTSDFSIGKKTNGETAVKSINRTLGTLIQNLMIALGTISLFIMTIGAGYMIFYNGQDELLSKGKSIFIAGIVSLAVALSSYYLISIVRFILYSGS